MGPDTMWQCSGRAGTSGRTAAKRSSRRAERELEADLHALTAVLADRWGDPATVELWPYLGFDDPDPESAAPEPLGFLCNVASTMRVWWLPSGGRWLALAVGQADPEFPFELLAAVGEESSLPR
ncbi:hypothetical protein [Kitasatospora sp. NPDC127116]|uniref:hypothetical protein n=1 Tax=Kitasatospora sp. NPDC127116 TaxID=3345367 RepID=UPI0036362EF6